MALKSQKYARKSLKSGLVALSRALTRQIEAILASAGYDRFFFAMRCKCLQTKRFPAALRLLCEKTGSTHFDPVYESVS